MNDGQIRIAIALECGWRFDYWGSASFPTWMSKNGKCYHSLPDYTKDLNACNEMEKVLTLDQQTEYVGWLSRTNKDKYFNFGLLHISAAQRCEAFLRAVGKWIDNV